MNLTIFFTLTFALLAAAQNGPVCECCGPEGPKSVGIEQNTPCYTEANTCSPIKTTLKKSDIHQVGCKSGKYYLSKYEKCFIPIAATKRLSDRVIRPCEADEGCLAEEGPMQAFTVRTRKSPCYKEKNGQKGKVDREYSPGHEIGIWCKSDVLGYLTTDGCWVSSGNVPAKWSAIPICGSWRGRPL